MEKIYYNNSLLKRSSELRKDKNFLKGILDSENVNFIPMKNDENYFILGKKEIKPLILKRQELELYAKDINLDKMIFLGKINEKFYFSINIKSKIDKNNLEIDQGDILLYLDVNDKPLYGIESYLERFFVEEESARNEKTFKAINYSPVPLPKMTEEDFFKVMIQVNYGGLAETIHKQWIKVSKDKNVIGLKDDDLEDDKEDE